MHCKNKNLRLGKPRQDLFGCVAPVHQWQRVVEHRDVRLGLEGFRDGVLPVFRLGDDVPSRMRLDDLSQAKPYDHVVVGNKDPCQVRSLSNAPLRQASTSRTSHPLGKPLVILGSNTDHVGEARRGSWAALGSCTTAAALSRATALWDRGKGGVPEARLRL